MAKRLDLVIFGATGFTGQYAVEEINKICKKDKTLTWGIAGRSQSKLEKVIRDLQNRTGDDLTKIRIIIADVGDENSLREMTEQAAVLVNCCGPYRFYGEPVVKACIATKTSHVDISGEEEYIERMYAKYNEAAQKAGVYIVSACGFDSIPADMGVIYLQKHFKGQVNSAETYLKLFNVKEPNKIGGAELNSGTWDSMVYEIGKGPIIKKLFRESVPDVSPQLKRRGIIHKKDNNWYLPFMGPDEISIYRTQRFLYETYKQRPVQMYGYVGARSFCSAISLLFIASLIFMTALFSCGRKLLLKFPHFFSFGFVSKTGPSDSARKNARFTLMIHGKGWDEKETNVNGMPTSKTMKVKVSGSDPGYGTTNIALLFAAITILKEADKMPGSGGVLPPGAAFHNTSLIENLQKNNLTFEIVK